MKFVSLAALLVAISAPAMAFDAKGNVGIGTLQSQSQGSAVSGGIAGLAGISHQDAASAGTAGAQLTIKPSGVTVLTQQNSATNTNQAALGLAGGFSFAGTQNVSNGAWTGIGGALKFGF